MKYKHIVITKPGNTNVLQMVEDDLPEPAAQEIRVKIIATGVAFTDVMMREGVYPGVPKLPYSPGYDIIGVVDAVGPGVAGSLLGQTIVALTVIGGYSEYRCIPERDAVLVPFGIDPTEAVSLVLHYLTADQMLHRVAQVKAGDSVLIHGAAGGVGTALLELGQLAGLEMYGTDSAAKHTTISALGATPIDYKTEDFVKRIHELTTGGMDVVFDAVGGENLSRSYKTLRRGGRLVSYGFLSAFAPNHNKNRSIITSMLRMFGLRLIPDGRKVSFYSITRFKQKHPDYYREDLTRLLNLLAQGKIKPIVADRLPLREAAHAHDLLEQGKVSGQLVLLCS